MSNTGLPQSVLGYQPSVGSNVSQVGGVNGAQAAQASNGLAPKVGGSIGDHLRFRGPQSGSGLFLWGDRGMGCHPPARKRRGGRRQKSAWDHHVDQVRASYPDLSFRDVLQLASRSY